MSIADSFAFVVIVDFVAAKATEIASAPAAFTLTIAATAAIAVISNASSHLRMDDRILGRIYVSDGW